MPQFGVFSLVVALAACADPSEGDEGTFPPTAWESATPVTGDAAWYAAVQSSDPQAAHQPEEIDCGPAGWRTELGELEIDTAFCNYGWFAHDLSDAWPRGSKFTGTFRHFDLTAPAPAETHARLYIDGQIMADWVIEIPGGAQTAPAAVLAVEYILEEGTAEGASIALHLHNHGQNNYALSVLQAARPEP